MKLIALLTGSDDSTSCEHLVIPDDMDLKKQKVQHAKWYKDIWKNEERRKDEKYYTLSGWMIKNGARYATNDEILEVSEDDL